MFTWKSLGGGQPDYPAALSSLQHMDSEQLKVGGGELWIWLDENFPFQDILNNEDKFDQFIRELPQMKALQDEKEMLLTSNKSLAEYNLSQVWFSNLYGSTMKSSQLQMKLLSYDRFEPGGSLNNRVSKVRLEQLESIHPVLTKPGCRSRWFGRRRQGCRRSIGQLNSLGRRSIIQKFSRVVG